MSVWNLSNDRKRCKNIVCHHKLLVPVIQKRKETHNKSNLASVLQIVLMIILTKDTHRFDAALSEEIIVI